MTVAMALKGKLEDFGITQLLNLINLARKTGTLYLDQPDQEAYLCFREGSLIYATSWRVSMTTYRGSCSARVFSPPTTSR